MSKMIQVRNVPDKLHREIAKRAKARHQSLTRYVQDILEREVATPSGEEVFARIRSHPPVNLGKPAAEIIREERAERETRWRS